MTNTYSYKVGSFTINMLKNAINNYFWVKHTIKKNRKRHICKRIFFKR